MSGNYEDMLILPHPVSARHPQMAMENRAAQFSPFAALTGYEAAIEETARLTDRRVELDADRIADLDMRLHFLADTMADHPEITVTYFLPDDRKAGGQYVTATGKIKKIDDFENVITLMDGPKIAIEDVVRIEGELFQNWL